MKSYLLATLLVAVTFTLLSCTIEGEETANIKDKLKISAYVANDVTNTGTHALEELKINEVRRLSSGGNEYENCNLLIEFEGGIVEVIADNNDMQLSTGQFYEIWKRGDEPRKRTYGLRASLPNTGYVALCLSGTSGTFFADDWSGVATDPYTGVRYSRSEGYIGKEHILTVKAYTLDNKQTPLITAKLKLVQSEEIVSDEFGENRKSQYFTIELTEYEYSDMYQLMEG